MRNPRNLLALFLAVLLLAACGSPESANTPDTSPTVAENTEAATETVPPDPYAGIDLAGMELRFLNYEGRLWNTMSILDFSELTGVGLDDAVYNRNRTLEDKLNMKIVVTEVSDLQGQLSKTVSAAEDVYDAVYTMSDSIATNVAAGLLQNLPDIPTLQLENAWWEPQFNDLMKLENRYLYELSSPINLMAMDMTVACYFNSEILKDHGVNFPYDVVREGKWTYDAMYEAMTPCITLNGDEKFSPKAMNATFGVATFNGWIGVLATVPDAMIKLDDDGTPYWAGATERMYSAFEKMGWLRDGLRQVLPERTRRVFYHLHRQCQRVSRYGVCIRHSADPQIPGNRCIFLPDWLHAAARYSCNLSECRKCRYGSRRNGTVELRKYSSRLL